MLIFNGLNRLSDDLPRLICVNGINHIRHGQNIIEEIIGNNNSFVFIVRHIDRKASCETNCIVSNGRGNANRKSIFRWIAQKHEDGTLAQMLRIGWG